MRCIIVPGHLALRIKASLPEGSVKASFDEVLLPRDESTLMLYGNMIAICIDPNFVDPATGKTAGQLLDDKFMFAISVHAEAFQTTAARRSRHSTTPLSI